MSLFSSKINFISSAIIFCVLNVRANVIPEKDQLKTYPDFLGDFGYGHSITIIDPLIFDSTQINLRGLVYRVQANISSGMITGLGDIILNEYQFIKEEIALIIKINIPTLKIQSEYYEMKGTILEFVPIAGKGRLEVGMKNFNVSTKIYLKQSNNGKSVAIDKLENSSFSIQNVWSHTDFDKVFDDILNQMVSELVAEYLTRFNKYLADTYGDYVVAAINYLLCQHEFWDIFESILNKQ